ncbi:MAG: Gfo/Idh/MocA family oxidoreductase, partial [Hyphomicrobiaceae bacterium]|nr:Gfo/Idh/MocA family oxidoreductase [Hyphomicrobiaceae bacterium]
MKFIVIGCGSIGKRYIDILLVLGHEVVAYNRGAARRNAVKNKYNIKVYGDLDEILAREQADAALICTPNSLHIENAWSAARHGLHLFIEKPLSHNLDNISEFQKEVLSRELIAHVGSNMRFHFGPAKIYEILQAGIIGRPLWAHLWGGMHLPSWHPDEDYRQMYSAKLAMGGGAVMDFIHELDLALWLFGEPLEVAGMVSHSGWLNIETEDVADGLLRYPKGLQVSLHVDYLQKP